MKRKPIKLIEKKIAAAIEKEQNFIQNNLKETNPLIVKMRTEAVGKVDAFRAVELALQGDCVILNIMSRNDE